jgi:hypothetical protein
MPAISRLIRRGLCPVGHGRLVPDPKRRGRLGPSFFVLQLWVLLYPNITPFELDDIYKGAAYSGREPVLTYPAIYPDRCILSGNSKAFREKRDPDSSIRKKQ